MINSAVHSRQWKAINFLIVISSFVLMFSSYFYSTNIFRLLQGISIFIIFFFSFVYILQNFRIIFNTKKIYKQFLFSVVLTIYLILVYLSTYFSRFNHVITNSSSNCLAYISMILGLVFSFSIFFEKDRTFFLKNIFFLIGISCIINDFLFFPHIVESQITQDYMFSGKFAVAYMHLEWITFYIINIKLNLLSKRYYSIKLMGLILYTFIICLLVNCSTGIVGLVLLIAIMIFIPRHIVQSPWIWLISLVCSSSFVLFYQKLLEIPWVKYIIVVLLHRSETLTGRTYIYEQLPIILNGHYLWGYGFGSDYETWHIFGYGIANSQNGIANMIVEQGLLATVAFMCLAVLILYFSRLNKNVIPIVSMIYVLTFLGSVEITFTLNFIALFILVFFMSNSDLKEQKVC